jgi:hypothetical protein
LQLAKAGRCRPVFLSLLSHPPMSTVADLHVLPFDTPRELLSYPAKFLKAL